jgi:Xaa-Pro dipeptidase
VTKSDVRVEAIQKALRHFNFPAWLFFGFKNRDLLAMRILGFPENTHITRRWFYLIPQHGTPLKLVHKIERSSLDHLPGLSHLYVSWEELRAGLAEILKGYDQVAMQYSTDGIIPYISRVDAGTAELIRGQGVQIVSSGDLIQVFESVLSHAQVNQHRSTALKITEIVRSAFDRAAKQVSAGHEMDEFSLQQSIMADFSSQHLETDSPPIVAVNSSSGDPHYTPTVSRSRSIRRGDFLLIDLWARPKGSNTVYADITWAGFLGSNPPGKLMEVFRIVRQARDRGVEFLEDQLSTGNPVFGWQVDDQVRAVIGEAGYGEFFVHRTGHNIAREVHGNGVNFDNLETHDTRQVIQGLICTIEPGIYLPEFGVRSEINILVQEAGIEITTPSQKELLAYDL